MNKLGCLLGLSLAGVAAFAADLPWPSDMGEQIAARKAAVLPSGDRAVAGTVGSFESIWRIERCSDGRNFDTTPYGTIVILW